ncbi:hypothetical protein ABPG74_005061 [Tetrahymena malaccensis]
MEQEGQQQIDYHKQSRQENRIWTKILYHRYSSGQVDDDKQHNASTDNSQIKTSNEEVQNDNHNNKPEEKYLSLLSESQVSDIIQQFRQHNQGECHSLFENLDKYDYINYQNVEFKIANEIMIQLKNITNVLATAFLESEKDKDLVNKLKNQQNVAFNIQNTDQLQFSKIELVKEKNQSYNSCSISTLSSFGKLSTVQEEDFDNFQLQKIEGKLFKMEITFLRIDVRSDASNIYIVVEKVLKACDSFNIISNPAGLFQNITTDVNNLLNKPTKPLEGAQRGGDKDLLKGI